MIENFMKTLGSLPEHIEIFNEGACMRSSITSWPVEKMTSGSHSGMEQKFKFELKVS